MLSSTNWCLFLPFSLLLEYNEPITVTLVAVFLAFALGLAVWFDVRDLFRAYPPNNVAGTTALEAGHVGEEQKRKVKSLPALAENKTCFRSGCFQWRKVSRH